MIKATVIQDSIGRETRITTFELEYPRFIHAEFMTHRVFSRNCASSRAIPVDKMHQHIRDNMATPIHWGMNQPGMQAKQEIGEIEKIMAKTSWENACALAISSSKRLHDFHGLHKQISNRITEPFVMMKTIVTATEWDNWYALRAHPDAQPEIQELAKQMQIAYNNSVPMTLYAGEWHVPYINRERDMYGNIRYWVEGQTLSIEDARIISASCCAQVSYRKSDDSLEKAKMIFDKLINSRPQHASPVEHQATPVVADNYWAEGVTHCDRKGVQWSGNFRNWIQFRQLLN